MPIKKNMDFAPEVTPDNAIGYDFGLKFKLLQIKPDSTEKEVLFIRGPEEHMFYGVFDWENVDFVIRIDNKDHQNAIAFEVKPWEDDETSEFNTFIQPNNTIGELKTLEDYGGHLHFLSQGSSEGKLVVAMHAHKMGISYKEASINCSRLKIINVEVEKTKEELEEEMKRRKMLKLIMNKLEHKIGKNEDNVDVVIRTLAGHSFPINNIELDLTVEDLKDIIKIYKGILPEKQRLVFQKQIMKNDQKLGDFKVANKSVLNLIVKFAASGVRKVFEIPAIVGERGVLCFGRKTDHTFERVPPIIPSKKYIATPFTIELRMKSKYATV